MPNAHPRFWLEFLVTHSKSNLGIPAKRWLENVCQLRVSVWNMKLAGPQCCEHLKNS